MIVSRTAKFPGREKRKVFLATSHLMGFSLMRSFQSCPLLAENTKIVGVWTDYPVGREGDRRIWGYDQSPDIKELVPRVAREMGASRGRADEKGGIVFEQRRYDDDDMLAHIEQLQPDVLISCVFGGIFSERVLNAVPLKFNFHPSGYLGDSMGWSVPPRYRGSRAVENAFEDIEQGDITQATVALHKLVPAIDRGPVFAWSRPFAVPLIPQRIPKQIGEAARRELWAERLRIFLAAAGVRVADLAETALPYLLDLTDECGEGMRAREDLSCTAQDAMVVVKKEVIA